MPAECKDCGLDYEKIGYDCGIPNEVWNKISDDRTDILCLSCMSRRIIAAGLTDVPLSIHGRAFAHGAETHSFEEGFAAAERWQRQWRARHLRLCRQMRMNRYRRR